LLAELWSAVRVDDDAPGGVLETIAQVYETHGMLLDPHSAVGLSAARSVSSNGSPMVCLATAHPAKFPDAVEKGSGQRPELPSRVGDLFNREERFDVLPNDLAIVQAHVREHR
jgi:threonine synthase